MRTWLLTVTVALLPAAAHADKVLDRAHQVLGEGTRLVVAGKFSDAEKRLREALRLNPKLPEGHYNLAVALRNLGQLDESVDEYAQALAGFHAKDEPNRAKCLYGLGLAKEARGDHDAWDAYIAFARRYKSEQPDVRIAEARRDAHAGIGAQMVRIAAGHQNDIAPLDGAWRLAEITGFDPAAAVHHQMERHQVLRRGHDAGADFAGIGTRHRPGSGSLDVEEHRTRQPDGPEHL